MFHGPNVIHIPEPNEFNEIEENGDGGDEWCKGFASEVPKLDKGKLIYVKTRDRNEPLDDVIGNVVMNEIIKTPRFRFRYIEPDRYVSSIGAQNVSPAVISSARGGKKAGDIASAWRK